MNALVESHAQIDRRPSLDRVEKIILDAGGVIRGRTPDSYIFPETHTFTPGLYIRELFMPAESILTTRTHITEHPYAVLSGRASVYSEVDGAMEISAPYRGVTRPGTRRLLFVHEDMIWVTFHATHLTNVEEIEKVIFAPWENPLVALLGDET